MAGEWNARSIRDGRAAGRENKNGKHKQEAGGKACLPPKVRDADLVVGRQDENDKGYLADLSMGGVQAMLEDAPEKGRLCRMKLHLTSIGGLDLGQIEAGVRVAKREAVETGFWTIGFAFESLVPVAEKTLHLAVQSIRAAVGNGAED